MSRGDSVSLVGELLCDPERRTNQFGDKHVRFRVTSRYEWIDSKSRKRKQDAREYSILVWDPALCEFAERTLHTGLRALIEGDLMANTVTDTAGRKSTIYQVVLNRGVSKLAIVAGSGDPRVRPNPLMQRQPGFISRLIASLNLN